jgi:nicotinamidase-related amidase
MNEENQSDSVERPFRSPLLMNRGDTALVVIDVQEKLLPLISNHENLTWNIGRLLQGAGILGVAACATEQYPKGLGGTVEAIAKRLASVTNLEVATKTMFSCRQCHLVFEGLAEQGIHNLLLCGIETHVCVAQTALDLTANGFNVLVCVDAVGSRHAIDHQTALRRMENCGVTPTTTEAVLFEWCEKAGSDEFKRISKLVQQTRP